jgi:hypothetical protein
MFDQTHSSSLAGLGRKSAIQADAHRWRQGARQRTMRAIYEFMT